MILSSLAICRGAVTTSAFAPISGRLSLPTKFVGCGSISLLLSNLPLLSCQPPLRKPPAPRAMLDRRTRLFKSLISLLLPCSFPLLPTMGVVHVLDDYYLAITFLVSLALQGTLFIISFSLQTDKLYVNFLARE